MKDEVNKRCNFCEVNSFIVELQNFKLDQNEKLINMLTQRIEGLLKEKVKK